MSRFNVHLVYGGRGPLQQQLEQRAQELGIGDRVHFPGFLGDHDRNALLARAAVAVFPSLYEPFGIVALEAMGTGTPVIVSDTGGLAEIVEHGVDGWKVPPGDRDALVSTIGQILADEAGAYSIAARGKQKTESKYTWETVAENTLGVYRPMVAQAEAREVAAVSQ
jgi:glycosyltransferase involved in cell wall biosynthesis